MAQRIDGKKTAGTIRQEVKQHVQSLTEQGSRPPHLTAVLVGEDPASQSYVRGKRKAAREVGISSETKQLGRSISEEQLVSVVEELNDDPNVDGILVQLPLPNHINQHRIISAIRPDKDVDGFHPENMGRLLIGQPGFVPATPLGIIELLDRYDIPTEGARAVIVGRSNIVGKPLAALFLRRGTDATVTVCHSRTRNLPEITQQADILVAAVGRAELITGEMVQEEAAVIDVGINRVDDNSRERGYRLVGDVAFEEVEPRAGHITPVPGGVGPMTIAMLLNNTYHAAAGTYYSG